MFQKEDSPPKITGTVPFFAQALRAAGNNGDTPLSSRGQSPFFPAALNTQVSARIHNGINIEFRDIPAGDIDLAMGIVLQKWFVLIMTKHEGRMTKEARMLK